MLATYYIFWLILYVVREGVARGGGEAGGGVLIFIITPLFVTFFQLKLLALSLRRREGGGVPPAPPLSSFATPFPSTHCSIQDREIISGDPRSQIYIPKDSI